MLSKDKIIVLPVRIPITHKGKRSGIVREEVAYGEDRINLSLLERLHVNPLSPQMQAIQLHELIAYEDRRDWARSSSPVWQAVPDKITRKPRTSIRDFLKMFIP